MDPRGQRSNSGGGQRGQQRYDHDSAFRFWERTTLEPRGTIKFWWSAWTTFRAGGNSRTILNRAETRTGRVIRATECQRRSFNFAIRVLMNSIRRIQKRPCNQNANTNTSTSTKKKKQRKAVRHRSILARLRNRAQMGIKLERDVVDRDPDGPAQIATTQPSVGHVIS